MRLHVINFAGLISDNGFWPLQAKEPTMTAAKLHQKSPKTPDTEQLKGHKKAVERLNRTLAQNVGRSIARYRKLAGFTQAKVADSLNIETETVSRLETGANSATLERLEQFANLYGCQVFAFFHDEIKDMEGPARTVIELLRPLTGEEKQLIVSFVADVSRLFRRRRGKDQRLET